MTGLTPKFHVDLSKETRREIVDSFKVEQCGRWPQQACTTILSLMSINVTSGRPIALLPTWIRWWEWLRARDGKKGIGLVGNLLTDEMEEPLALCGDLARNEKMLITVREKKTFDLAEALEATHVNILQGVTFGASRGVQSLSNSIRSLC